MSKLISLASFAALLLTAGIAHAEPPCPGSNNNGCSWTCTQDAGGTTTYHVMCQNTAVGGIVPRCYDVTNGVTSAVACGQEPPPPGDSIDAAFDLIYTVEDEIQTLEVELDYYEAQTAEEPLTEEGLTKAN